MCKKIISLSVAIIIAFSVLMQTVLFAGAAGTNDYQNEEVINALNALLVGVRYDTYQNESDVEKWSDETVCDVIHSKLLWDDYRFSDSSYLNKANLKIDINDDGEWVFNPTVIQKITQDTLKRDFSTNTQSQGIYVSDKGVVVIPADGESATLSVQNFKLQGNRVLAVGIAVQSYSAYSKFRGYFQAEFEVNSSSVYGYTLVSINNIEGNQSFNNLKVGASSELKETNIIHYAKNVFDDNPKTAWVEGVNGVGSNEWVKLESTDGEQMEVSAIEFSLGYHKSPDLLQKNGWPSRVMIECDGGYSQEADFYSCEDSTVIILNKPQTTSFIKITILDAAEGIKYEDTCISEIDLYGIDTVDYFSEYTENDSSEISSVENDNTPTSSIENAKPQNNVKMSIPLILGIAAIGVVVIGVIMIIVFKSTKGVK